MVFSDEQFHMSISSTRQQGNVAAERLNVPLGGDDRTTEYGTTEV